MTPTGLSVSIPYRGVYLPTSYLVKNSLFPAAFTPPLNLDCYFLARFVTFPASPRIDKDGLMTSLKLSPSAAFGNLDLALLIFRLAGALVFLYHGSAIFFGAFGARAFMALRASFTLR